MHAHPCIRYPTNCQNTASAIGDMYARAADLAFCLLALVQGVDGHADGERQKAHAYEQGGRAPREQLAP